jgi:DivIVA domain-containing protein
VLLSAGVGIAWHDPPVPILLLLAALAVLAVVALVASGRGDPMPAVEPDRSPRGTLPTAQITPDDIDQLRFSLGFRGYRMDEVDTVLDRLTAELAVRDKRIAELESWIAERDAGEHDAREHDVRGRPDPQGEG